MPTAGRIESLHRRTVLGRSVAPSLDLSLDRSIGCWLLAIGYWLMAIGNWLLASGYWLLAIGCWLLAIGYWLLAIWAAVLTMVGKDT